jgi:hypothetical protein
VIVPEDGIGRPVKADRELGVSACEQPSSEATTLFDERALARALVRALGLHLV